MQKKAVLVASFGTSHQATCNKNIQAIESALAEAFPGWEIRRAFTSAMIRRKLLKRDGVAVDSVEEGLERLAKAGCRRVLCQPTHVINGEEFDQVRSEVEKYSDRFSALGIGAPLLTAAEDYKDLAAVLAAQFLPQPDTAYCLMGHGSARHPADAAYGALGYRLQSMGRADICVGTVEGFPDFDAMLHQVKSARAKRCVLVPLMVVAGDHAVNDMAGEGEGSWRTRLQRLGFAVECVQKGLGEYPEVRALYARHARAAAEKWGL